MASVLITLSAELDLFSEIWYFDKAWDREKCADLHDSSWKRFWFTEKITLVHQFICIIWVFIYLYR